MHPRPLPPSGEEPEPTGVPQERDYLVPPIRLPPTALGAGTSGGSEGDRQRYVVETQLSHSTVCVTDMLAGEQHLASWARSRTVAAWRHGDASSIRRQIWRPSCRARARLPWLASRARPTPRRRRITFRSCSSGGGTASSG